MSSSVWMFVVRAAGRGFEAMKSQGPSGRHARARTRGKVTVQYRNIINKQARDPRSSRTLVKEGVAGVTVPEIFQPPALAEVLRSKVPNFAVGVPFMSVRVSRVMAGILTVTAGSGGGREREGGGERKGASENARAYVRRGQQRGRASLRFFEGYVAAG